MDVPQSARLKSHPDAATVFTVIADWLEHLRLSSVRLNDGGSGSFVSADGLVLTNHHVVVGQLQKLSTPQKELRRRGSTPRRATEEMKAHGPGTERADVDGRVTARVRAQAGRPSDARRASKRGAQKLRRSRRKTSISDRTAIRCRHALSGAREYWLYRYKRYTDVRLVFAPEQQAAFFGGDPDNFTFPRYDLDFALVRAYENGKPALRTHAFPQVERDGTRAEKARLRQSGHPGSHDRTETVAAARVPERDINYTPTTSRCVEAAASECLTPAWSTRPRAGASGLRTSSSASRIHSRRKRASITVSSIPEDLAIFRSRAEEQCRAARVRRPQSGITAKPPASGGGMISRGIRKQPAGGYTSRSAFAQFRGSSLAGIALRAISTHKTPGRRRSRTPSASDGFTDTQLQSLIGCRCFPPRQSIRSSKRRY